MAILFIGGTWPGASAGGGSVQHLHNLAIMQTTSLMQLMLIAHSSATWSPILPPKWNEAQIGLRFSGGGMGCYSCHSALFTLHKVTGTNVRFPMYSDGILAVLYCAENDKFDALPAGSRRHCATLSSRVLRNKT